jgi:hypothetical protein
MLLLVFSNLIGRPDLGLLYEVAVVEVAGTKQALSHVSHNASPEPLGISTMAAPQVSDSDFSDL